MMNREEPDPNMRRQGEAKGRMMVDTGNFVAGKYWNSIEASQNGDVGSEEVLLKDRYSL